MGVVGVLKFIFRRVLEILLIVAILALIPNLPPYAGYSKNIKISPSKPFTGKLSLNNRLEAVEIWHKGDFVGPESFADHNGELYTSLYTGDVVKLTGEHITPVVKFGKPCKEIYEESICGRPLGLEFDQNGFLYAIDSYYGIFKVNVKTGEKEVLVSSKKSIEHKRPRIFNSLTLAKNGDIYWTDSSTDFSLQDGVFTMLADPSGRLIHYDAKKKQNRVLLDGLYFANGVALSENEDFIIVAETGSSRIQKYYLSGPKKGKSEVFVDGLPGLPDNLKADGKGGFLVPLVFSRDSDHPLIFQSIGPFPFIRKAVSRFFWSIEWIFKKVDELYPNELSLKAVHFIGHFQSVPSGPKRTTILRINADGAITDSAHSLNGKLSNIAEAHVFKDTLYLGSAFNDYVARIPLATLGWQDLKKEDRVKRSVPVEAPKTTTSTPKPTTPRPTTTLPKATTTTPRPTTTTPKPTTTTPRPTTTTPRPTTTTPKPTTTTPRQTATTPKPTTTNAKPSKTQKTQSTTPKPATTTTQKPVTASPKSQSQPSATSPPPTPKKAAKDGTSKQGPPAQAPPTAKPSQQTTAQPTKTKS